MGESDAGLSKEERNLIAAYRRNYADISGWSKLDDRKQRHDLYETNDGRIVEYEGAMIVLPNHIIHHVARARVVGEGGIEQEAHQYSESIEVSPIDLKRKLNGALGITLKKPLTKLERFFALAIRVKGRRRK